MAPTPKKLSKGKAKKLHSLQKPKRAAANDSDRKDFNDLQTLKKSSDLRGYFLPPKKGRRSKPKSVQPLKPLSPKKKVKKKKIHKSKRKNKNWKQTENFPILKAAVVEYLVNGNVSPEVSDTTLKRYADSFKKIAEKEGIQVQEVKYTMIFPQTAINKDALLSQKQIDFLDETCAARDEANKGMSRLEAIEMISEMSGCANMKTCENHWDYLIRKGVLSRLKNGGKVAKAQSTTTKRTQVTVEQQLRWHENIEYCFNELDRLNQPSIEFQALKAHFIGNVDESCFLASDGKVRVIASSAKKKTEKITSDTRDSITSIRGANAAGEQFPFLFLLKGKTLKDRSSFKDLHKSYSAPKGSRVFMTPSAYMTDEAWLEVVPVLCKQIRDLPVVRDHPDWWFVLSLDGYNAHVHCTEALQMFADHKIFVVKEEGESSQVNQAYDQNAAREDKTGMRESLNKVSRVYEKIDQWKLTAIAITAQLRTTKETWITSFKRVNMHPSTRVSAEEWLKKLDEKGVLAGEKFFEKRTTLYDAMPAVWKDLAIQERQKILKIIKDAYDTAPADAEVWTKARVIQLAKYVPLSEIHKLRACYFAAEKDPSVVTREKEEISDPLTSTKTQTDVDEFYSWQPKKRKEKYIKTRRTEERDEDGKQKLNEEACFEYFHHITNKVSESNWNIGKEDVQPSRFLDVAISSDQKNLLNPSYQDVLMGHIKYDMKGEGAVKKLAKRKLDFICGNVNSYSKLLNGPERLEQVVEANKLVANIAAVQEEQAMNKAKKKKAKQEKDSVKEEKKNKKLNEEAKKKEKRLPYVQAKVAAFTAASKETKEELSKAVTSEKADANADEAMGGGLRDIVMYHFNIPVSDARKMRKPELIDFVINKFTESVNTEQE
ncbi:hypothetical protein CTEN210_02094 [Chaetoceros tenuissimus]|uniref:Uncharacterized protein n=1 Tax=Chaetoceros tenuissimus TaxID=426638 RepID=A0AAD3H0A5_9STRA|nr:hypothetical protein CTEN210_02094 [Chaetoceros tenuissimus]